MSVATAGQWLLLGGYAALLVCSAVVGWRRPRLRPLAAAAGSIAVTHVAYYAAFLVWPDWLGFDATMLFSIAIRLQVLFLMGLGLGLAAGRGRWR